MHGEAAHWQRRLRREFDDPRLCVRWNEDISRFQVGQIVACGASDRVEWFYTLTDGNSGFRSLDARIIRKLHTLDKKHQPNWTASRIRAHLLEQKAAEDEKRREETRYEMLHELKFAKGRFWNVSPEVRP